MRRALIAAAVVTATFAGATASRAGNYDGSLGAFFFPDRPNGPWCAKENLGAEWSRDDCRYATLEACTQAVIAGNRGTCMANPWYRGEAAPHPRRHHKKHG
ncbi:MAG TPA: DUF3551 domain-containing protein [Pseudolabrys sp.]|nr:DUF3551 domain-containing protein [Pseudolabrys sp.]